MNRKIDPVVRAARAVPVLLAVLATGHALASPHALAAPAAMPAPTAAPRVIAATSHLGLLTIDSGGLIAPAGKSLTMTVDGIGVAVAPGTYRGDIVLTVTDAVPVRYRDLDPQPFRAAVYVDDGRVVAAKSVLAASVGGRVDDAGAHDVRITSREPRFNGIVVTGHSSYVIDRPEIDLTGNGGNDFAGYGAAIMSSGHADVVVNAAHIVTHGAVRTAVFVGGDSTMHVNDSMIETYNGTLPPDYKFTVEVGRMMEVPWMLGLRGNVRATNLVDHGTVYYTRCTIRSEGWGALSTDDAKHVRMYVRDSLIETTDSGYGAYSIGDSIDTFSASLLDVADVGIILAANGSAVVTDGSVINSRRFGVMMHSGRGGSTLTIDKGSTLNTRSTAIQIKGRGADVVVDNAAINPGNGIILQAMPNDDPFLKKMMAGAAVVGVQGPGPGAPGGGSGGPPPDAAGTVSPDVTATYRNITLVGDMINARPAEGAMSLGFQHATITGALSTGTAAATQGREPTAETYYLIGDVTNTLGATAAARGLAVALDATSRWVVTRTSYLTGLTLAPGASIAGRDGRRVTVTLDGRRIDLRPGSYTGRIVVDPA